MTSANTEKPVTALSVFRSFNDEELKTKTLEFLHSGEITTADSYAAEVRKKSFLHGRIAGKMAIRELFPETNSTVLEIVPGSLGEPHVRNLSQAYGISIAHGDIWNAALCFPLSFPMGIDVESISGINSSIIPSVLSDQEKEICRNAHDELEFFHLLWTAKEAAGKAIRLGFRVPTEWYEIDRIETIQHDNSLMYQCHFKHLSVFTSLSVVIPGGMLSIAFPSEKNMEQSMFGLLADRCGDQRHFLYRKR